MSEDYDDYEDDGEDDEEGAGEQPRLEWQTGLALGFLAMLPLLVAYEFAAGGSRSTAELLLLRSFAMFGEGEDLARRALLAGLGITALVVALKGRRELGPALARIAAEGALLALLLGPALVGLFYLLGVAPPALSDPDSVPEPARAAFVFGAAAWEELLFRVAAYSALYLIGRRVVALFGAGDRAATLSGEVLGLTGSALLFAGAHLAHFTGWLGTGGEPYDPSVFTWRLLAGILLALVFRWRGPGVAAWTHGLFNLALLLGAGPDVFLST
jgi:CAAX prenyl protease-like protein